MARALAVRSFRERPAAYRPRIPGRTGTPGARTISRYGLSTDTNEPTYAIDVALEP